MSCKPAPACKKALTDATAHWPKRNRASDGLCGDAAHAKRKSDHNPDASGFAHAFDLTDDPKNGPDCGVLAGQLTASGDPRVKYIIWNSRIWYPGSGWKAYTGPNKHTKHMHVSIKPNSTNDLRPWPWTSFTPPLVKSPDPSPTDPTTDAAKGVTSSPDKSPSETEGTPPPADAVEVKASETSWKARLGSISIPAGVATVIGAVGSFVQNIPPYAWFAFAGVVIAAMVIGFLVWRENKREAHQRTLKVLDAGADKDKNNLRLV